MMRTNLLAVTLVAVLAACSDKPSATIEVGDSDTPAKSASPATASLSPEDLGELGARIEKQPNDAQKLLSEKGLNDQSFEQAIRKIAEDPEASKRYAEAYKLARVLKSGRPITAVRPAAQPPRRIRAPELFRTSP